MSINYELYNYIIIKYYNKMNKYYNNLKNISKEQIIINNNFLEFIKSYINNKKFQEYFIYLFEIINEYIDNYYYNVFLEIIYYINNYIDKNILNDYKYIYIKFKEIFNIFFSLPKDNKIKIIKIYYYLSIIFTFLYKNLNINLEEDDDIYQSINHYLL